LISLIVNGAKYSFAKTVTPAELIDYFELTGKKIALERNGSVIPRSQFSNRLFQELDRIEIITAVGGG
tara:strand:+ start:390 stop:593 length:204 start_codon:yes stop_codon:yes gene_type:complete